MALADALDLVLVIAFARFNCCTLRFALGFKLAALFSLERRERLVRFTPRFLCCALVGRLDGEFFRCKTGVRRLNFVGMTLSKFTDLGLVSLFGSGIGRRVFLGEAFVFAMGPGCHFFEPGFHLAPKAIQIRTQFFLGCG